MTTSKKKPATTKATTAKRETKSKANEQDIERAEPVNREPARQSEPSDARVASARTGIGHPDRNVHNEPSQT